MPVTTAPATEACVALVARINAGTAYTLPTAATYQRVEVDTVEESDALRVDVIPVDETQLSETLAVEDRTSHTVVIWIRKKLANLDAATIDALCLLTRQIYQQVNNWDSADGRVRVWETSEETELNPDKAVLNQMRMFVTKIVLRVEVEAI